MVDKIKPPNYILGRYISEGCMGWWYDDDNDGDEDDDYDDDDKDDDDDDDVVIFLLQSRKGASSFAEILSFHKVICYN